MADLTIVGQNVRAPSGFPVVVKLATVNMEPMQPVYAVNTNYVGQANSTNATAAQVVGVTMTRAYANQPVGYVSAGVVVAGATINTGQTYALSLNAGLICNESDVPTNNYLTLLGWGNNSTTIELSIKPTGILHD